MIGCNFYDDFSDGDPADGSPVKWLPGSGWDASAFVWTPEGLEVAGAEATGPNGEYYIYRDVSITVQTKRVSDHTNGEWLTNHDLIRSSNVLVVLPDDNRAGGVRLISVRSIAETAPHPGWLLPPGAILPRPLRVAVHLVAK